MFFDKLGRTMIIVNKKSLYFDRDHLSRDGSLYVSPVFDEVFKKMVNSN